MNVIVFQKKILGLSISQEFGDLMLYSSISDLMPKNILWKIYANITQQHHPYSDSLSAEKTANSM